MGAGLGKWRSDGWESDKDIANSAGGGSAMNATIAQLGKFDAPIGVRDADELLVMTEEEHRLVQALSEIGEDSEALWVVPMPPVSELARVHPLLPSPPLSTRSSPLLPVWAEVVHD